MSVPGLKMESIAWGLNYSFFINCSTHCTPSSVVEAISLTRSTDQSPLIVSGFTWKITYRISAWSKTCQILHSVDQNLKTLVSLGSIDVVQTGQELILLDVDKRHLTLCVNKNTVQDLLIKNIRNSHSITASSTNHFLRHRTHFWMRVCPFALKHGLWFSLTLYQLLKVKQTLIWKSYQSHIWNPGQNLRFAKIIVFSCYSSWS